MVVDHGTNFRLMGGVISASVGIVLLGFVWTTFDSSTFYLIPLAIALLCLGTALVRSAYWTSFVIDKGSQQFWIVKQCGFQKKSTEAYQIGDAEYLQWSTGHTDSRSNDGFSRSPVVVILRQPILESRRNFVGQATIVLKDSKIPIDRVTGAWKLRETITKFYLPILRQVADFMSLPLREETISDSNSSYHS